MLFPWVGLLEQIRLADVFIHYDDVQFSKGSFVNRVQIKTEQGLRWMTVPLADRRLGQRIDEVRVAPISQWRSSHVELLSRSVVNAPFAADALALVSDVYDQPHSSLASLSRASMMAVARYFGLGDKTRFVDVRELGIGGSGSERVLSVVRRCGGSRYVTGHGAAAYLDHDAFERAGVQVDYMDYAQSPYPQSHGAFTPYVSSLDLVAHCGRAGANCIASGTTAWKEFLYEPL